VHLPEELGCVPCRRHVHPQQASAPAALLVSGACDPAFIDCVRQGACGKGLGQVRCSTRRSSVFASRSSFRERSTGCPSPCERHVSVLSRPALRVRLPTTSL